MPISAGLISAPAGMTLSPIRTSSPVQRMSWPFGTGANRLTDVSVHSTSFKADDGIRAIRYAGSCHDTGGLTGTDGMPRQIARRYGLGYLQDDGVVCSSRRRIGGAKGITVHAGIVIGGDGMGGLDVFAQDTPQGRQQFNFFRAERMDV